MSSSSVMIARNAARFPQKTALVCENRSVSFLQLEQESNHVAHGLLNLGLKKNTIVPVLLPRGCDEPISILAIWKAGLTACVLDINYPPERQAYIRSQCGTDILLDETLLNQLRDRPTTADTAQLSAPAPQDPALVVFTSGSTGHPKGVLLPHRTLSLHVQGNRTFLREDDVALCTLPHSFVGVVLSLISPLACGCTLHIASNSIRKDVYLLAEYIRRHAITFSCLVPQMAAPFLAIADGTLRCMITGMERVQGLYSSQTEIINLYGASETCGGVTCFPIDRAYDNTPSGKPYAGSRIFIVDTEGRPVPQGEVGEIFVQGQTALGYLNLPELTAKRFAPAPELTGNDERVFRTGDLGRLRPDGLLEYVQRKDWMFKIKGLRVEPGEIEAAMLRAAPLDKAVVTSFEDASGQTRLYACYTASSPIDAEKLRVALSESLPSYMIPAFMEQLETLPLNANGKIDRRRLAPPDRERFRAEFVAPQTDLQKTLCQAFSQVLGQERLGLDDDFLQLGGDSISAMRMQALLPQTGLLAAMLLRERTPRAIARCLEQGTTLSTRLKQAPERDVWPLTFAESQIVAEYALAPDSVAYNLNLAIRLEGVLDVDRLMRALAVMVRRHRILRSYYPLRSDGYVHCLMPDIPEMDVLLQQERCSEADVRKRVAERNVPFDLSSPPLFRCTLFTVGPKNHILHFTFHHSIIDGLSARPLLETLWDAYERDLSPQEIQPIRPDYLDFAVHQTETPAPDTAFFSSMFADGLPENDMPIRHVRPDTLPCTDAVVSRDLSFAQVEQTARRLGVTPYALLTAAFSITLAKYCDSEDVVLGMTTNYRPLPETVNMVGMFANSLPVRLRPVGELGLHDYIRQTAALLEDVRSHSDCPFSSLVALLAPERNAARAPLFDVSLNYMEEPEQQDMTKAGLSLAPFLLPVQDLPMDLTLKLSRGPRGLHLELRYATSLYQHEIVDGMLEHYSAVLERICTGEDIHVVEAAELSEAQCRQILEDFSRPDTTPASGRTVVDDFRTQARLHPEKRAVALYDTSLCYAELDALTDQLASLLAARGLGRGDVVGILVKRGLMMPVGALGVLKCGAAYLPLDPSYPSERLDYMLEDAGASLLIREEGLEEKVTAFSGPILDAKTILDLLNTPPLEATTSLPSAPQPEDLLTLIYTSGTTGKPKGVMLSHANLDTVCRWLARYYATDSSDVVSAYVSFGFDACLMELFLPLTNGACVQIVPENLRLDMPALNAYFEQYGVTLAFMPTQLGRQFAETMPGKTLHALSVGGESLGAMNPPQGYAFYSIYGPTECTINISVLRVDRRCDRVPLGKPLDTVCCYILDKRGRLAPVGTAGELCVAGRQVTMGYLNRPDLTAERFTPNPFCTLPGYDRIYHTGDIIRWLPDGNLDFIGRRDFQVKIRGFRVELTEIEGRIRQHEDVAKVAVVAMDAPGGGKCAVAYVVMREGCKLDLDGLSAFIAEQLPPYMIPAAIMAIPAIPITPNGKVDRRKLPPPNFAAAMTADEANEDVTQPESLLTKTLREILVQILGHEQFSRTSNLLYAGLSSLSAIRLAALLDERLGVAPAVRDILAEPSLMGLENALVRILLSREQRQQDEAEEAVKTKTEENDATWPLAQNQLGIYFDCVKRPDTLAYNVPLRLDMPASVDAARLAAATAAVITAHAALHIRLETRNGRVCAVPLPKKADIACLHMDEAALNARAAAFVRPFDLFAGPLWRAEIIATQSGVTLLWDAHHLVFDGASLDILLRSLNAAYQEEGMPSFLQEKISVHDWAREEATREHGQQWQEDKAWFDDLLQDFEAASQIPSDMPPTDKVGVRAEVVREMDSQSLDPFCREHGLTPAALCLAAVGYVICRWTQGQVAWLSTISNGRSDVRLRQTVGMFVRTVPLRVAIGEAMSRLDYAHATQATLRAAVSHENYPYTRICEDHGFTPHIMYACDLGLADAIELDGQPVRLSPLSMPNPKFRLSIHVEEREGRFAFAVQYDNAFYSAWLMERLADTLVTALANMMAEPQAALHSLSLVSAKQAALLDSFNQTRAPLPEAVLHRKFEAVAARCPEHMALVAAEGSYTYAHLNAEANRLAHGLLALGVQPEDRVAFVLPRTGRILIAMLGILKAGCAYIPLDPNYPAERIAHVLEDSGARFLLTEASTESAVQLAGVSRLMDMDTLRAGQASHNPDVPVSPEQLAYLIYTSGSTGKPKGVMLHHAGIANYVTNHEHNRHVHALAADAHTMLSVTTVAFDMFLKESMTALCNGLTLVLADDEETRDPVRLAKLFARTKADAFNATPSRLLEYVAHPPLREALLNCRILMAGGEAYSEALLKILRQGKARLFNTYGPTEITVSCNGKELTGEGKVTVGAPLLNVQEYVVDADNNVLPCGMIGELLVGGMGVARGYNNLPEQTAARFSTFGGQRIYRTGDYARWTRDGEIIILGRNDKQIKLRGLRIELGEVEKALAALPEVTACVVGIRSLKNTEHLCAWYVGREMDTQYVREQLSTALPQYMIPTALMFLTHLPTLPNGKTDVGALPDPEAQAIQEYVPPATELERQLCAIYATVLGMEQVGATDSFFDLGGSSLSVVRLLIAAEQQQVQGMSYADIFAHPTPRALASCLTTREQSASQDHAVSTVSTEKPEDYAHIHSLLERNTLKTFCSGQSRPVGNVLITGGTGFLGSHILHNFLQFEEGKICCLLRRGRYDSVEKRLKQLLYYYFEDTFDELWGHRLFVLESDVTDAAALANAEGGLPFKPDTIINCAANVTHFAKDSGISDVNIGGVQNLVELALRLDARLVHISTASVSGFSVDGTPPPDTCFDERSFFIGQYIENQYVRSKFLAERIVLEAVSRGLDTKIMRVGNLMARNRDGEFQINMNTNSFIGRLRAWYTVGGFPYSSFLHRTALAPIDSTARAVLLLATAPQDCRIFHPFNNHTLFMGDIVEAMREEGLVLPLMEDEEFAQELEKVRRDPHKSERLVSFMAYSNIADGKTAVPIPAESAYTAQALLRHGWHWPETGSEYLRTFIRGLEGMGFFDL